MFVVRLSAVHSVCLSLPPSLPIIPLLKNQRPLVTTLCIRCSCYCWRGFQSGFRSFPADFQDMWSWLEGLGSCGANEEEKRKEGRGRKYSEGSIQNGPCHEGSVADEQRLKRWLNMESSKNSPRLELWTAFFPTHPLLSYPQFVIVHSENV